jgi:WD40 repeat protein
MTIDLDGPTWYYIRDRKKVGPVAEAQLRELVTSGQIRPGDMLLAHGATHWQQAVSVDGLFPTVAVPPPLPNGVAAPPSVAAGFSSLTLNRDDFTLAMTPSGDLPKLPGYLNLGEVGRGGMGVVYKAEHVKLKRLTALKMLLGGVAAGRQNRERFQAEAEAVARLQHPNIVQVFEVGEHEGLPFLALEYCDGGSLAQRLDGTPLPQREAAALLATLARAIQAAHARGIVHRDLKPGNVLLSADGVPKISDFGLAKMADSAPGLTQSGAVLGTPSYMAPEQAEGKTHEQGPAVDVYALGAILYELLTGRPPFKGSSPLETLVMTAADDPAPPSRLQPKLSPDLETICLKCLEKSPARRYASAQLLADDLHSFLAGEPIQARPAGWAERCWKWARRRPALATLAAVSVLALFVILIGGAYFTLELQRERNTALAEKAAAETERGRAEANEAAAKSQEDKTRRQEQLTNQERLRAEAREADARRDLEASRRSLLTAQLWRVAGLLEHDPMEALAVLENRESCPPDLRDFAWRYYRTLFTRWKPVLLSGHRGPVEAIAVRNDGQTLASASSGADPCIKLWNLKTRKEIATLRDHKGDIHCLAFSPDGALLASGGEDRTVKLWDVDQKRVVATLSKHSGKLTQLAFSPDGQWLASSSMWFDPNEKQNDLRFKKGEVQLWNVPERKHERTLASIPTTGIQAVSFAPDGNVVAFGTTNHGTLNQVDLLGKEIDKPYKHGAGWVYRVEYSPDGQTLAWSTAQQAIFLEDVADKKTRLALRGHQSDVDGLSWSPDGKTLATGSDDGVIKLWNVATGAERLTLKRGGGGVERLAFTTDGNTLIAAQGNQVVLWDLVPRTSWATYPINMGFRTVALSPDGQTLAAAASRERTLKLRNLGSGKERSFDLDVGSGTALAFAPNVGLLAVGLHGWVEPKSSSYQKTALPTGECQLWDVNNGRKLATLKTTESRSVGAVAFTPDGRTLITGDSGGRVFLWDVTDPAKTTSSVLLGDQGSEVLSLALTADGRIAAVGGDDGSIKLWDLVQRSERTALKGHKGPVTGLGFLDDGESLASTGYDRSVRIWDVAGGKERFALPLQSHVLHALAVSKDGKTLALACHDRTIKLWDLPSRQLRAVLLGHTREVTAATFSRDGNLLLSASAPLSHWYVTSGEVKVWKADP